MSGGYKFYILWFLWISEQPAIVFSYSIEWDGRGMSTYGGQDRSIQGCGGEPSGKETTLKTQA